MLSFFQYAESVQTIRAHDLGPRSQPRLPGTSGQFRPFGCETFSRLVVLSEALKNRLLGSAGTSNWYYGC